MRNFKSFIPVLLTAFVFAGCDTDDLRNDVDELKNRVESLEAQVSALNDNVNALKVFVDGNKTIKSYEKTTDGYKIVLSDGEELNITQGSAGQVKVPEISISSEGYWVIGDNTTSNKAVGDNAPAPKFSIKKYTPEGGEEGYYWFADDELVLDEDKKPVQATTDGNVSIQDEFFKDVIPADDKITLVMHDNKQYSLPIVEDLTCEIVTTDLQGYKDGVLTVGFGKTVKIPVKVSGDNYAVTAPYGWTAVLGEVSDGTATLSLTAPLANVPASRATADNTKDLVLQVNKGVNWAIDKIQVVAVEVVDSYYDLYNSGEDIVIAGVTINKTNYPNSVIVSDGEVALTSDNTVYFVKPGDNISLKYVSTSSNIGNTIIIGDNSLQKSNFVIDGQYIKLKEVNDVDKSIFLCHNLNITANKGSYSMINYGHMKQVIFDKCNIKLSANQPFYSNSSKDDTQKDRYIDNFIISNSVIDLSGCTKTFFVADGLAYPNFGFVLKNNIFYSSDDYVMRLFSLKLSTISFDVQNNTFYKVTPSTNGYFFSAKLTEATAKNNIFYSTEFTGNNLIARASIEGSKFDFTDVVCSIENNVGVKGEYTKNVDGVDQTVESIWQVFYGGSKPESGCSDIINLEVGETPFASVDEPLLIFKPKAEYSDYGAKLD